MLNTLTRSSNTALIRCQNVCKTYGEREVLRSLNFSIISGEFVAITGKSGSGKSTLLNLLTGIDLPSSGEVFIAQTAVNGLDEEQRAVWRGRQVGIVFQFFQLLPHLTALENITLPMDLNNQFRPAERRKQSLLLLEKVGLADQAHKRPGQLSGGQQQRVAIARALANNPSLLVADEPTGNLDSQTGWQVFDLFRSLSEQSITVVMVTHDTDMAAQAGRIIRLVDGSIVQ